MLNSTHARPKGRGRVARLMVASLAAFALAACTTGGGSSDSGASTSSSNGTLLQGAKDFDASKDLALETLKGKKVGFVPVVVGLNPIDGWIKDMEIGFESLDIEFTVKDPAFDPARFTQAIDAFINEKVDVLIVQNPDVAVAAKQLQKAQDAGIYVIQLNLQSSTQTDAFIGGDLFETALRTGKDIGDACSGEEVAIVTGNNASYSDLQFVKGYKEGWGDKVKLVGTFEVNYEAAKARDTTATLLKQNPNLCGVISSYPGQTSGVVAAVKQAGKSDSVKVWTSDASNYACTGVISGELQPGWAHSVQQIGFFAVAMTQQLIESGQAAGSNKYVIFTPTVKLDKAGAEYPTRCFPQGS